MCTEYDLVSNIPLSKLLGEILPQTAFRNGTPEEFAQVGNPYGEPQDASKFQERYGMDHRTATVAAAVYNKQFPVMKPGALLMSSPPGATCFSDDRRLNVDWIFVRGGDDGVALGLYDLHCWPDSQYSMIEALAEAISAAGYSVNIWNEHEPQYWGYTEPHEIAAWQAGRFSIEGCRDQRIIQRWTKTIVSQNELVGSYRIILTHDNYDHWCVWWPSASILDFSKEDQDRIAREWVAEVAPGANPHWIGRAGSAVVEPFEIHAYSSGEAGHRERFEQENRPALIERYSTGKNRYEPKGREGRTLGWHWIEDSNKLVERDPFLIRRSTGR
jgi:hypothetical protein